MTMFRSNFQSNFGEKIYESGDLTEAKSEVVSTKCVASVIKIARSKKK